MEYLIANKSRLQVSHLLLYNQEIGQSMSLPLPDLDFLSDLLMLWSVQPSTTMAAYGDTLNMSLFFGTEGKESYPSLRTQPSARQTTAVSPPRRLLPS